jgi:hypothetical protein
MSSSSRRTYDTDSIVLRRVFAYDISNNTPFSTGFVLTSLTKGVASFVSPNVTLSTIGFPDLPATISTLSGELLSTAQFISLVYTSTIISYLPSTVEGLGTAGYVSTSLLANQLASTVRGLGTASYVSTSFFNTQVTSTIQGLGTLGYLSSAVVLAPIQSSIIGLATSGYVSSTQLTSSLQGLGRIGYISSTQLTSSLIGLGTLGYVSTLSTLGSLGFVSSTQLTSTVGGLAAANYVSSTQLRSTVQGLGSLGYLSTSQTFRSTYSNLLTGNWSNVGYIFSSISANTTSISTIRFDLGSTLRSQIVPSTTRLDIELKPNLQFVYYDGTSRDYQFNSFLVRGPTFTTPNIIGQESLTYYILNTNPINLAFFFQEKTRFLINNPSILSTLRNDNQFSTLSLHHTFGNRIPTTNQFFATPASSICATVVLDNTL